MRPSLATLLNKMTRITKALKKHWPKLAMAHNNKCISWVT